MITEFMEIYLVTARTTFMLKFVTGLSDFYVTPIFVQVIIRGNGGAPSFNPTLAEGVGGPIAPLPPSELSQ